MNLITAGMNSGEAIWSVKGNDASFDRIGLLRSSQWRSLSSSSIRFIDLIHTAPSLAAALNESHHSRNEQRRSNLVY